jgi:hypothetical protein
MTTHKVLGAPTWMRLVSVVVFIGLMGIATRAQAQDMRQYLDETREMVRGGRFEEALERMVWFHHHALDYGPGMAGVRLSFALSDWKQLGDVYPPARAALVATRDTTLQQLLENPGESRHFQDLNGLNRVLGEESLILDVFAQLAAEHPEAAKNHWSSPDRPGTATRLALEAKRLDLLRAHGVDLLLEFDRERQQRESMIRAVERGDPRIAERAKQSVDRRLVEQSLLLIEIGLALGQEANARTIQERALAIIPDQRIRGAIP